MTFILETLFIVNSELKLAGHTDDLPFPRTSRCFSEHGDVTITVP